MSDEKKAAEWTYTERMHPTMVVQAVHRKASADHDVEVFCLCATDEHAKRVIAYLDRQAEQLAAADRRLVKAAKNSQDCSEALLAEQLEVSKWQGKYAELYQLVAKFSRSILDQKGGG